MMMMAGISESLMTRQEEKAARDQVRANMTFSWMDYYEGEYDLFMDGLL